MIARIYFVFSHVLIFLATKVSCHNSGFYFFLEILVDHNDEDLNLSDVPFGRNGDGIMNLTVETDSDSSDTDSIVSSIEFAHTSSRLFSNEDDTPSTDDSLDWQF